MVHNCSGIPKGFNRTACEQLEHVIMPALTQEPSGTYDVCIDELTRTIAVEEIDELTIYGWFCEGHAGSDVGREDDVLGQLAG
jgi:hypothetical protein